MAPCTDSSSTIQNSQIFCQANPWRRVVSTKKDMHGSTVKGVLTVTEPSDLLRHRRSWPPNKGGTEGGASVRAHITLARRTNFPTMKYEFVGHFFHAYSSDTGVFVIFIAG